MLQGIRPTYAEIDLSAIRHNFRLIRKAAGADVDLLGVVKADAYGHGAVAVSRALIEEGASLLAVALIEEAVELRSNGIEVPILVMGAIPAGSEHFLLENNLTPYIFDLETARNLSRTYAAAGRECRYHLKVDTGMGRIGVRYDEIDDFLRQITQLENMRMDGLMTHFARADEPAENLTDDQAGLFRSVTEKVHSAGYAPRHVHAANSAAIFTREIPECNLARPGIALYGGWPSHHFEQLDLRPAMNLRTQIAHLKSVPAGTGISYGHKFVTSRSSVVATLPIGYADGYNRLLTNRGEVLVKGTRAPVIGTVCMDWILIDVTDVDGTKVGDEVTLLGVDRLGNVIRSEEWADRIGTINYEVFCGISKRVPRVCL